jgi:hypothetical protein
MPTYSVTPGNLGVSIEIKKKFNEFIKAGAACISMHIMAAHWKYITKLHLMTGAGAK